MLRETPLEEARRQVKEARARFEALATGATEATLTVGEIRKAIKNLSDDCKVTIDVVSMDMEFEDACVNLCPVRAFRDVRRDVLVIDVEDQTKS